MKKLIVGASAGALMVAALGVAPSATAAEGDGYPGVVNTTTTVSGPTLARVGQTRTYTGTMTVAANESPCEGSLRLTVWKGPADTGTKLAEQTKPLGSGSKSFGVTFNSGKGRYTVKVKFVPEDLNPCKGSHDDLKVKVKKKKR